MYTPTRTLVSKILGFGAAALFAASATASAAQNVWTGASGSPIWFPSLFIPVGAQNWSTGAFPTATDDVIFPKIYPTFPLAAFAPPPLNELGKGNIIILLSLPTLPFPPFSGLQLTANSLTFQNDYRLVDYTTLIPFLPFPFPSAPILLTSGNITVTQGATAEIDYGLDSVSSTITKLGKGTLLVNGTIESNVLVQEGTLGGSFYTTGNLTNLATLSPGNSPGTIRVEGNFTQKKSGTLSIQLASPTSYDRILANGQAYLGGKLSVSYLDGFEVQRGQKFDIIHATGGVVGKFNSFSDSRATGTLLTLGIVYHPNDVYLQILQGSFAALPDLTPNQRSVARELDHVVNDHRVNKLIDRLDRLQLNDVPSALDRIAPEELTSIFTLGTAAAKVQSINIQRRTDDIRAGSTGFSAAGLAMQGTGPGYSGTFGITTGVAGPSGDDGKASKEIQTVAPEDKRWGAFVTGTGEWISVTGDYNARGYELTTGGFTVGVDYKLTPHVAVGINAGYVGTTTDLTGGGRISVNGGKLGLYGTFFENRQPAAPASTGLSKDSSKESKEVVAPAEVNPGWYADVAVDGGYSSYSISRAAFEGAARSQTDGGDLNVLAGIGYDFKKGALTFGPTATFNYTYVGIGSFTERGSLAPLHFGSQGQDSLRSAFGFKASYDCKVGGLAIKPEIRAAWQHEYGDSVYAIDSSFANGAGGTFTVNGPKLGRDSVLLGAGFAVQCSDRCSAYVYYDGELGRTNYHAAAVTGGVRFAF